MKKKIQDLIVPVLFFAMIVATSVCYLVFPDKEVSKKENRMLAQFPSFSISSLADGEYTSGIIDYMNDQFPFRDSFMKIGNTAKSFLKRETKLSDGVSLEKTGGNVSGGAGERIGDDGVEITEREVIETVSSETTLVIYKDRAMEYYTFNDECIKKYAELLNSFSDYLDGIGVRVYSLVVPTSSEFYLPENLRGDDYSQKTAIDKVYSQTNKSVVRIDAYSKLEKLCDDGENYVYFRTDHHWTQFGAYSAYQAFCEAAGIPSVPLSSFTPLEVEEDFYGSFTKLTDNKAIVQNPDRVVYWYYDEVKSIKAYTGCDMQTSYATRLFANTAGKSNKYLVFLGGDQPLIKIQTKTENGRNVLVLKDSFGNAFVPFLINHYEHIYVVDPRTTSCDIKEFCTEHGINDVIIENYAFSLSGDSATKLLSDFVK